MSYLNNKMNRILSEISVILSVCIAILSAKPWFIWHRGTYTLALLGVFMLLRFYLSTGLIPKKIIRSFIFACVLCLYLYSLHAFYISDAFTTILTRTLPLCLFILFNDNEKSKYLKLLIDTLSYILLISLLFFIAFHLQIPLPYSRLTNADSFYNEMYNYYAFVIPGHSGIFTRFQSVFTEPGHLGMIIALLFYIDGYDFKKWQSWILIISLLWTFSVAGYLLFVLGYIVYKVCSSKQILRRVIGLSVVCTIVVCAMGAYYKSNPDSLVSTMILERLQFDDEKGLSGNNRNTQQFMQCYTQFKNSFDVFWGLGTEKYQSLDFISGNSSYRCFVLEYGILGLLLLACFYISCIEPQSSKIYWGLFILYCFSFWQRPYALWEIESFSFIAFSSYLKQNRNE